MSFICIINSNKNHILNGDSMDVSLLVSAKKEALQCRCSARKKSESFQWNPPHIFLLLFSKTPGFRRSFFRTIGVHFTKMNTGRRRKKLRRFTLPRILFPANAVNNIHSHTLPLHWHLPVIYCVGRVWQVSQSDSHPALTSQLAGASPLDPMRGVAPSIPSPRAF